MAVLSDASDDTLAREGRLRVVVSADDTETHRRVALALAAQSLPSLQVSVPSELFELDLDSKAIVVLVCDLDAANEMAMLRRLRRELRAPAIVAISRPTTGTGVRRALEAGADAVVFEPELESTLAVAVSAVATGQSVVPRKMRASVQRPALSHRERQVLAFVSKGLTNAQIAQKLVLSESTIKSHLSSVFEKLGVRSRREAAALFRDLERATIPLADRDASEGARA
jgi:DNA-binding NarL/FixJ family response regulator